MTCIIGLVSEGRIYLGGDSAAPSGWNIRITRTPKVFKKSNFLIGYTSSFRMGQLLQHRLTVGPQGGECDNSYMVNTFTEAVRQCLKDYGYSKTENNREEGGQFLVGYRGHLYHVYNDFQVAEFVDDYGAVGCGEGYALGAMKAMSDVEPKARIEKSLEIAAYFSNGVAGPFHIVESDE